MYLLVGILCFALGVYVNASWKLIKGKDKIAIWNCMKFWYHKILDHLEDAIALGSALIFISCLIYSGISKSSEVSIQYLSIFSTFIFAWLITKKATEMKCRKEQEPISTDCSRVLSDAEIAAAKVRQDKEDLQGAETIYIDNQVHTEHPADTENSMSDGRSMQIDIHKKLFEQEAQKEADNHI